ncbi:MULTISPECIES: AfsR/SARP family transcriptional regulator [unclassified Crossiella]|uniref:AfsR/SARP family transcriptional regulator n=1 Tax=unclassified Crossiella TaxID=2620835 RepID=UPI001FFF6CCA|nr:MULTISPECIES: AfsR/SARP family transcriptional regulator [unclassified Crossiella]MCK2244164.1 AfsR/SARP family transcriptional regulator [Crossiella sp. S99.2]MCK2257968.1 AfsR/SARP family transcriptional regulator [Crossiella sp. S99.1]
MKLRLLGAMEMRVGGTVVPLGARQHRLVLAIVALQANQLVPLDRLVELVWPVSAPRTAAHAIRVCVSRLRGELDAAAVDPDEASILTHGSGYILRTDPQRIDVHRFQSLIERARCSGEDETVASLLDQALALWQGPPLACTATEETRSRLFDGLAETRLVAMEDRLDALLRLDRHKHIVGELTTLAETYPTRERLVCQLMLALHRGGQASQALVVARRTRERLAEELGIDPGEELRRLELAILRNDPDLGAGPRGVVAADCPYCTCSCRGQPIPRRPAPAVAVR